MMRSILCAGAMLLTFGAWATEPAPVRVLDGPEVQPMRDGLNRVGCRFVDLKSLDEASLAGCRVLVICGTRPPVDEAAKPLITRLVEAGGSVLAVGGGATRLIDLRLFDAQGYYMSGTTTHNTAFDGYHRLIFGYPGAKPPAGGTTAGVSGVLRATQGPLMTLGPKATSILTAGGQKRPPHVGRAGILEQDQLARRTVGGKGPVGVLGKRRRAFPLRHEAPEGGLGIGRAELEDLGPRRPGALFALGVQRWVGREQQPAVGKGHQRARFAAAANRVGLLELPGAGLALPQSPAGVVQGLDVLEQGDELRA